MTRSTLDVPLLAIGDAYDWNVPPSQLQAWAQSFAASGKGRVGLEVPCVTHALNWAKQNDYRQITPADIGHEVDGRVVDAIVAGVLSPG